MSYTREKLQEFINKNITENGVINLHDMNITSLDGILFPEKTIVIYLFKNPIQSLPNELPPNLKVIQFPHNQIQSLANVTFPPELVTMQSQYNKLTSLDGVAFPSKLTELHLSHNQITSLDGVVFPPGLVSLDLSNNQITSFAGMQFPLSLFSLKLAGNPIDVRTVTELKNPSPFVIREIVAAFPETGPHFQRMEEEQRNLGEKVEQLFKMLYALNMKKEGGAKSRRKTCRKMKKM